MHNRDIVVKLATGITIIVQHTDYPMVWTWPAMLDHTLEIYNRQEMNHEDKTEPLQ